MSYWKESIQLERYEESEKEYNRAMEEEYFGSEEQWKKLEGFRKNIEKAYAVYQEKVTEEIPF